MEKSKKVNISSKYSIKNRILIYILGSVILVSVILTSFFLVITYHALKNHINTKNERILLKLERIISVPLLRRDYVMIVDIIDEETRTSNLDFIWVLDSNANVIACNDENQIMLPIDEQYVRDSAFKRYEMKNGGSICILPNYMIIYSIGSIVFIGTFIFLILLLTVLAYFTIKLTSSLSVPIQKVVHASSSLAQGNFDITLPDSPIEEIDILTRSLIETAQELKKFTNDLEQLVKDRTNELEKSKDEAESANHAKSEFLANISHEIRTPLNAITGFGELLSSSVTDPKQLNYLDAIKIAGKSLLVLINDILDLSKVEAGKFEIQLTPVNLHMLFNEIEQIFRIKIDSKKIDFGIKINKDLPPALYLDEVRLRQVLLNIVGNSVKFTESGQIKLSAKKRNGIEEKSKINIIIEIEDTGIGIPKDDQEIIFESFKQQYGQSQKKFGGTGLGLSISKKLVEMMGGNISIKSEIGKGSIFKITLDNVFISSTEVSTLDEDYIDLKQIRFKKGKILIVDDVKSNCDLLYELLSSVGLDATIVTNGKEALNSVKKYRPDLILMDIRMPVMDGIEATRELKSNPQTKDIPVIALSASSKPIELSQIVKIGFDGYLPKPVNISILIQKISEYIDSNGSFPMKNSDHRNDVHGLTKNDVENYPELLKRLEDEMMPIWEDIKNLGKMSTISEFANRITELGDDHNIMILNTFGKELKVFTDNYDIANIEYRLKEFPGIIEEIVGLKE